MRNLTRKAYVLITLGFFVFSLMVMVQYRPDKTGSLQEVILQVQELQHSSTDNSVDFKVVFSNTITTLQNTAGLHSGLFSKANEDNQKTIRIVVQTRTPYLFIEQGSIQKIELSQIVVLQEKENAYLSHSIPPETPPPMTA